MIGMLTGKIVVVDVEKKTVIVNVRGVGYLLYVTEPDMEELLKLEEVSLYVYTVYKEGNATLYGFFSLEQRNMFGQLIMVKGVGPATAITILSEMAYDDFAELLVKEDIEALVEIKGIGKKTAENIISKLGQGA